MLDTVKQLIMLFSSLIRHPDKKDDILNTMKELIDSKIVTNGECLKIYSTINSNDPFYAMVIPTVNVLFDNDNKKIKYFVDIDLRHMVSKSNPDGATAEEMTIWLLHELSHNVMSPTTKLRIEQLLLNNTNDESLKDTIKNMSKYGLFFWCDMFTRTSKKPIIDEDTQCEADKFLLFLGYGDVWNSILQKYIRETGGHYKITSDEYNDHADYGQWKIYMMILREMYSVKDVQYPSDRNYLNRQYQYVIENMQSNLIRDFTARVKMTDVKSIRQERDSFIYFDDTVHPIHESIEVLTEAGMSRVDYLKIAKSIDEIDFEIQDVRTVNDKIAVMYKIREWMIRLEKMKVKDISEIKYIDDLKARLEASLTTLRETKLKSSASPMIYPPGYEG